MVIAASVPTPTPALCAWQRLDASWPTLPDAFGLDAGAQRLVRQRLTEATGRRLQRRRSLPPESRRLWETRPHLAQYVRQPRFYANLLHCYALTEMPQFLYDEVRLAVEVLETPPGTLGVEVWQGLLALQCQRAAQPGHGAGSGTHRNRSASPANWEPADRGSPLYSPPATHPLLWRKGWKQARKKSEADHLTLWLIAATFLLGFCADKQADISKEGTAHMSLQHNQPGPQVPWQPGPAFPSPPAAPAGGEAAPIPRQVVLAAERAGLGTPIKEYNRGAANSRFLTAIGGVGGLIGFISLLLGVPIIIGTLVILPVLIAEPLWTKMLMIGFGVVSLLLFAFFIRLQLRGTSIGGGAFRAWSCPNGLAYKQGRQIHALRWEQLGLVYRKMANVNGVERITGYAVQPINAPAFQFSTLGGKLAGVANAARPGLRIRTNAGMVINRGGTVHIMGAVNTSAYEGLGELIEEHLVAHQLPLVRDLYQSGQTVAFGKLLLHQQGLSDGTNVVSWEDYHYAATHDSGYILVYKKPEDTPAFQVTDLPNVALLNVFLGEIRASQRRNSPEYRAEKEVTGQAAPADGFLPDAF